jgi:hypothetical protein
VRIINLILLLFFVVNSEIGNAQVPFPELTRRIKNLESPVLEEKVNQIFTSQLKKNPSKNRAVDCLEVLCSGLIGN